MSEVTGKPTDTKASKRPNFVRQLSKSYEKSKEAVKRNLLTPRGPRTAKSAELPFPETKSDAPTDSAAEVAPAPAEAPAAAKAGAGDAQTLKVDIKATHDATTPVELLVDPAETGAVEMHEGLADTLPLEAPAAAPELEVKTPAPTPEPEAKTPAPLTPAPQTPAPQTPAPQPEEAAQPVQKEVPSLVDMSTTAGLKPYDTPEIHEPEVEPAQVVLEEMPADLSCAPPAVSVSFGGAPAETEDLKAATRTFTPEQPQGKKGRGLRRVLIGLAAIAAASVAAIHARR